jgi:CHAT domain-containing protein/Tfp pilus assembly protein PilF
VKLLIFAKRPGLKLLKIGLILGLFLPISISRVNAESTGNRSKRINQPSSTAQKNVEQANLIRAIALWKKSASTYHSRNQKTREIETLLTISQGYISLGDFRSAISNLRQVIVLAPSDVTLAIVEARLGNAYSGMGNLKQAERLYKSSLEKETSVSTLNNLVTVLKLQQQSNSLKAENVRQESDAALYQIQAKEERIQALTYAKRAFLLGKTETSFSSIRAMIEWSNISHHELSPEQLDIGKNIFSKLPPSPYLAFLMLNWSKIDRSNRVAWLNRADDLAKTVDDISLESYVSLELGYFYEEQGDLKTALGYAQSAQLKAQSKFAYDSLFRAQQLAGRIYQKMGRVENALDAYRGAIVPVDILSRNLVSLKGQKITNFNNEIEPIYHEILELLLGSPKSTSATLKEALVVFEKLRLSQLRSYFGDNCFGIYRQNLSSTSILKRQNAALINSIMLKEKVVFLLQLKDGRIIKSEAKISKVTLTSRVNQWHQQLKTGYSWEFRDNSQFFYDLIIRPFEAQLKSNNSQVLVFIHDGMLRNVPMAALLDGDKFLPEKWASASSIGLNFTSPSTQKDLKAAAFGLKARIPGWNQLKSVEKEIDGVQDVIGGHKFLDQKFTVNNFSRQLKEKEYSVVHLATHGYFGGTAQTSFILAYDRKISISSFKNILDQSREIPHLMVLSACETAAGNSRALLGLAGVSARSGVTSTIGSFWLVEDRKQSEIVHKFYSYLDEDMSNKAIALQRIQVEQIRRLVHPATWASLNLIGDW